MWVVHTVSEVAAIWTDKELENPTSTPHASAWITISDLRDTVTKKRHRLQLLRQKLKLASILKGQVWSQPFIPLPSSSSGLDGPREEIRSASSSIAIDDTGILIEIVLGERACNICFLEVVITEDCLENFKDDNEFWYISRYADESEKGVQRNDKWWLPTVKVPPEGITDECRKWLQHQKDCVNQVDKASMAINAHILSEMEIPENYIESLPKVSKWTLSWIHFWSMSLSPSKNAPVSHLTVHLKSLSNITKESAWRTQSS